MRTTIFFIAFFLFVDPLLAQTTDLSINYMLTGDKCVKSSIKDTASPGGFWESKNAAHPLSSNSALEKGFILKIDTNTIITISEKYNGYKFYIVNNTDSIIKLHASDSRINVIAEVLYNGKWLPIEYLPESHCGNSYHWVYLKPSEYWQFDVPRFKGNLKTKLRFKLILSYNTFLYSNEIKTSINKAQLNQKSQNRKGQ